jgi:molecular chaperone GrpE
MTEKVTNRKKDFSDRIERLTDSVEACSKTIEAELSDLTCVKGELSGIVKELARIQEMLADTKKLTEEKLDAIGDAVEILEEELAEKHKKAEERSKGKEEEYLTSLQYLKADFENYKRRTEKEKQEFGNCLRECILLDFLPIKDALEVAIGHAKENNNPEGLIKGVEMTVKQIDALLKREGLEEIAAEGEHFDPFRHEVVAKEAAEDQPEDTVIAVLRKGYLFHGKVIRPAMVKIAMPKATDES